VNNSQIRGIPGFTQRDFARVPVALKVDDLDSVTYFDDLGCGPCLFGQHPRLTNDWFAIWHGGQISISFD
jgi:hypothetical protein